MQMIIDLLKQFGMLDIAAMIGAITTFLVVVCIPVAKIIPGEFPDKQLQWLVDIIKKIPSFGAKKE